MLKASGAAGLAGLAVLLSSCGDGAAPDAPGNQANPPAPVEAPADAPANEAEAVPSASVAEAEKASSAAPCLTQDDKPLDVAPLRAVGTEPFWGARIEGRCVTYSHPDDQKGTRIWTRYAPRADGGAWTGTLGGKPFELRTRKQADCSDGMSDKVYPVAVDLVVQGEKRSGCAEEAS